MPSAFKGRVLCFAPDELDAIEPLFPGMQLHRERREIEGLAHSIAALGQLEPGSVYLADGEPPRLVFGCRRLAAARMVRDAKLSAEPRPFWAYQWQGTLDEAVEAALDENDPRLRLLAPIDRMRELLYLTTDGGMSRKEAANRIGEGEARSYQLLMMFSELDERVIEEMERGRLGDANARALIGLPEKAARKLFDRFRSGEIDGAELARLANAAKRETAGKVTLPDRDLVAYLLTLPRLGLIVREIKDGNLRIESLACVDRGMAEATDRYVWDHFRIDREAA